MATIVVELNEYSFSLICTIMKELEQQMYVYGQIYRIPSTLVRGGTSKGLILRTVDLPKDPVARDQVILKVFGSPGNNQIDGIGGERL